MTCWHIGRAKRSNQIQTLTDLLLLPKNFLSLVAIYMIRCVGIHHIQALEKFKYHIRKVSGPYATTIEGTDFPHQRNARQYHWDIRQTNNSNSSGNPCATAFCKLCLESTIGSRSSPACHNLSFAHLQCNLACDQHHLLYRAGNSSRSIRNSNYFFEKE